MKRFSKTQLIADLNQRGDAYLCAGEFDRKNGTSQLWPRGANEGTKALIERAIRYGTMTALLNIAEDVETGFIGVAPVKRALK